VYVICSALVSCVGHLAPPLFNVLMTAVLSPKERPTSGHMRKRLAIMVAARELFLSQGYSATAVDAIAARAFVSKQTLYNHFGSKERLFSEMVDEFIAGVLPAALDASATASTGQSLGIVAETFADLLMRPDTVSLYRLALIEAERHPELGQLLEERAERPMHNAIVKVLVREGIEDQNAGRALAAGLIGGIKELVLWPRLMNPQQAVASPSETARAVFQYVGTLAFALESGYARQLKRL
jgi:AcrR family transcriptional regulator